MFNTFGQTFKSLLLILVAGVLYELICLNAASRVRAAKPYRYEVVMASGAGNGMTRIVNEKALEGWEPISMSFYGPNGNGYFLFRK
jgi:hypothetical protein